MFIAIQSGVTTTMDLELIITLVGLMVFIISALYLSINERFRLDKEMINAGCEPVAYDWIGQVYGWKNCNRGYGR